VFPEALAKGDIMKYVYLLQSLSVPTQRYVGVTTNLEARLQSHNAGASYDLFFY
jgi:predicted GIY-YIG superfamily endonuclease